MLRCDQITLENEKEIQEHINCSVKNSCSAAVLDGIYLSLKKNYEPHDSALRDKLLSLLPDSFELTDIPLHWIVQEEDVKPIEIIISKDNNKSNITSFANLLRRLHSQELELDRETRIQLLFTYIREAATIYRYCASLREYRAMFLSFTRRGTQYIAEFSVNDISKPILNSYNWHGQNTSQWIYAGCILVQEENGKLRVSSHH